MDRDVLMHQMTERFQELYSKALDALERAPDGQWIAASEFAFRDAFLELMKECYQEALQDKIDAHPTAQQAAFPPPNPVFQGTPALRNKGRQPVGVLTVEGEVELSRRYFRSQACGGTYPADALVGIDVVHASAGAREFCCSMGIGQDFQQAAEDLTRLTGLRVSAERLRQLTEREGDAVARARREGVPAHPGRPGTRGWIPADARGCMSGPMASWFGP
jgi:hypothetical protein